MIETRFRGFKLVENKSREDRDNHVDKRAMTGVFQHHLFGQSKTVFTKKRLRKRIFFIQREENVFHGIFDTTHKLKATVI